MPVSPKLESKRVSGGGTRLERLVSRLKRFHGKPPEPPTSDPFGLIVWEQVGYLADDERRLEAYRMLEERVGLDPADILHAPLATLRTITRQGGAIGVDQRAKRLGAAADRVVKKWNGNLGTVLDLPMADAKKELTKYPGSADQARRGFCCSPALIRFSASSPIRYACCSASAMAPSERHGPTATVSHRPQPTVSFRARLPLDVSPTCC